MKVYMGIDIGTTNTKIMVIGENGVEKIVKTKTPKKRLKNVEYFDLDKLTANLERIISQLKEAYDLSGLSCTSVGESVVPVANGKKLHDPIVWYDTCTKQTQEKYEKIVAQLAPYEISGSRDIYYFPCTKYFICMKTVLSNQNR